MTNDEAYEVLCGLSLELQQSRQLERHFDEIRAAHRAAYHRFGCVLTQASHRDVASQVQVNQRVEYFIGYDVREITFTFVQRSAR